MQGAQSVLAPHGQSAEAIAGLSWVLMGGGVAILLLVVLATWIAIVGPPAARALLAGRRAVVIGGIVFPVIVLSALLLTGVLMLRADQAAADDPNALRIEVTGEQWWWRVAYALPDGSAVASANEIRIPTGRPIVFTLKSADVIHSFWVPSLAGKLDMIPGRVTRLRLMAEREGVYRGQCAEYCGGAHALMGFKLVALAPADFDAWLAREAGPAVEPADNRGRQGRALFLAAGCGGCHAVRGTGTTGRIGPDLTHIGSRLSVGVDTQPMSAAALADFIAEPAHLKPGSPMPPFRLLAAAERDALAAYLLGLK